MRSAATAAVILACASILMWMRGDEEFPISTVIPFLGGPDQPAMYNWAGLIMIGLGWWGISRMYHKPQE